MHMHGHETMSQAMGAAVELSGSRLVQQRTNSRLLTPASLTGWSLVTIGALDCKKPPL